MDERLPKTERLCGKKAMETLFGEGRGLGCGCIRCRYLFREGDAPSRIVVSVPKRLFKRAVKRNLLKRRLREAYRRQKGLLPVGADMLLAYNCPEVLPYETIFADMGNLLSQLAERKMQLPETPRT